MLGKAAIVGECAAEGSENITTSAKTNAPGMAVQAAFGPSRRGAAKRQRGAESPLLIRPTVANNARDRREACCG
jgi:hypothetical protein